MQQAITWANVDPDLCRQMASLGHNELNEFSMQRQCGKLNFWSTRAKTDVTWCSIQNSTCPGQLSTRPTQNKVYWWVKGLNHCFTVVCCLWRLTSRFLLLIRVGATTAPFNFLLLSLFLLLQQYLLYMPCFIFILDRCHCSYAAVTPVKYENDIWILLHNSEKKKKIIHRANWFSDPHP